MDYEDFCQEILMIDHDIRFAGICDMNGEIRYGGERPGIVTLFTAEETKRSLLQALARWELRSDLASKTGKGKYAMAEYERLKRISVPIDETHLLLVSPEASADHRKIIDGILKLKSLLR